MAMQQDYAATLLSLVDEVCGLGKEGDDFLFFNIFEAIAATPDQAGNESADMFNLSDETVQELASYHSSHRNDHTHQQLDHVACNK